jgi:hypothetical protein
MLKPSSMMKQQDLIHLMETIIVMIKDMEDMIEVMEEDMMDMVLVD